MAPTVKEIAWLAGLLEGEGTFGYYRGSPTVQLQMTDGDVVARAATLMGVGHRKPWLRKDGYKPVYACIANGTIAAGWMQTVYVFLGERRQAKIREVLSRWKAAPGWPHAPRGTRFKAICHPEKFVDANGLCNTCYMREWRAKRKRAATAAAGRTTP